MNTLERRQLEITAIAFRTGEPFHAIGMPLNQANHSVKLAAPFLYWRPGHFSILSEDHLNESD